MTEPIPDKETDGRKARYEALLALALDDAPAPPRPSDAEIAAWHDGKLDGERADAVRAWVARSAEGYALWSSLPPPTPAPTATVIPLPTPRRRSYARTAALTLVPAALAATVLLTVLPRGPANLDESLDAFAASLSAPVAFPPPVATKAFSLSVDVDRAAYASGVRSALLLRTLNLPDWQVWLAQLPNEPQAPCASNAPPSCSERLDLMRKAGRWSALAVLACRSSPPSSAPPALPAPFVATADELAKRLQALHPTGFAASVAAALQGDSSNLQALCATAAKQINALP